MISASMRILLRLRFTLIALVAALCMLGAQQAAAFHAVSHLADESSTRPQLPHSQNCDICFVYADINGAGPTIAHAAFQIPAAFIGIATPQATPLASVTHPVYSARAPPHSV
jgi:hypothetical protein